MSEILKSNWSYKRLDELGFIGRGKSKHRPRDDPSLYGGKYPFIQTGEVKAANLYISQYSQTYNEKGLSQSKLWKPETLLITIAANIAETAILKIEACFPDSIVGFIADPKKADVRYVKYCMDTMKLQMQNVSKGTTQDNLSLDKLLTFGFPTPPLSTQRKIASLLSAYDDLIENNTRRIKILEEMAQALYREWFVNFKFPGHEKVRMVESELGMVPEGWKKLKLGDIVSFKTGKLNSNAATPNGIYPFFTCSQDILRTDTYSFDTECVLLGGNNANGIYPIKYFRGKFDAYQRTYVIRALDDQILSNYYLFFTLQQKLDLFKRLSTGAATKFLTLTILKDIEIICPPINLQCKFSNLASIDLINNLESKNANLRRTRDLLLPKLISGEVDVENIDVRMANNGSEGA